MRLLISILFFYFLISSCDFSDNRLTIINKSNNGIYYRYSCDSNLGDQPIIVNNYYYIKDEKRYIYSDEFIPADSSKKVAIFGPINGWKKYLKDVCNNKIYIYIFSEDIINQNDWDTVRQKRMFIKSYTYNFTELKNNNWTIIYP